MPSQLRPEFDAAPFEHPADAMEPDDDVTEQSVEARAEQLAKEKFLHLVDACMPSQPTSPRRRSKREAFACFVVLVHAQAPDLFDGIDFGKTFGISSRRYREIRGVAVPIQVP